MHIWLGEDRSNWQGVSVGIESWGAIGIGASAACDGQILVTEDMLGFGTRTPLKFVKQYMNAHEGMDDAIEAYSKDVKNRAFPATSHTYCNDAPLPEELELYKASCKASSRLRG